MTHNPNVYGYVNGKPVFSRDEFIFEHRKRGPIEDDAELIAFAEKATSGWHNAGWSHSFTNTLTIGSEAWLKVVNGSHTLKIVATDAKDASVTRTLTFTKAVTSVEFEQTLAMEADAMPTKALVNIQGNFPAGCTLQVWICNNGNDASPTWEDITQKARTGQKHYFTNQTKTAAAWGVKVKAKLLRGSATETCYIQSIGGNFA